MPTAVPACYPAPASAVLAGGEMTRIGWDMQAWVWRIVARRIPTCFLQGELSERPGVDAVELGMCDEHTLCVSGPCVVTVNRD